MQTKEFYTTGGVAKIIGIAPNTVVNYCKRGLIKYEENPLTHYRRIYRDDLIEFMRQFSIPLNLIEE